MYRTKIDELIRWKNSPLRKPLIMRGARQVGKTWLLREFGKQCYKQCVYVKAPRIASPLYVSKPILKQCFQFIVSIISLGSFEIMCYNVFLK